MDRYGRLLHDLGKNRNVTIYANLYPWLVEYMRTGDETIRANLAGCGWPDAMENALWRALPAPDEVWDERDWRLFRLLVATIGEYRSGRGDLWYGRLLEDEPQGRDTYVALRRAFVEAGKDEEYVDSLCRDRMPLRTGAGTLNSAGRYIASMSREAFIEFVRPACVHATWAAVLLKRLQRWLPERAIDVADYLAQTAPALLAAALGDWFYWKNGDPVPYVTRCQDVLARQFGAMEPGLARFRLGQLLVKANSERHRPMVIAHARELLRSPACAGGWRAVPEWLLDEMGEDALPDILWYIRNRPNSASIGDLLKRIVPQYGRAVAPVLIEMLREAEYPGMLLQHLITLGQPEGAYDGVVAPHIRAKLAQEDDWKAHGWWVDLARTWGVAKCADLLWPLLAHKSVYGRGVVADALADLGDAAIPQAERLLEDPSAIVRAGAVRVLSRVASPAAIAVLEARYADAPGMDQRDALLDALMAAWAAAGRVLSAEELAALVKRHMAGTRDLPPTKWMAGLDLPPLCMMDGSVMPSAMRRFLYARHIRHKEIAAVPALGALYAAIEPASGQLFAQALCAAWLAAGAPDKDRWALALACLLGDDRLVPPLRTLLNKCMAAKNMGGQAVAITQGLSLLGTDGALMVVESLIRRCRDKTGWTNRYVYAAAVDGFQAAADRRGVSLDELADCVVPTLGFEPGVPRIVACGKTRVEVRIGADLKLAFGNADTGKPLAALPGSTPAETKQEVKDLAGLLRETVKAQAARLEAALVSQHRWPAARWRERFLGHPVLIPFGQRLVWGIYGPDGSRRGTFRPLEDGSLTDTADGEVVLPDDAQVGLAHPLELGDDVQVWIDHLADYEVEQPFPQLARPVRLVGEDEGAKTHCEQWSGATLAAMTFRGRADRLGWRYGHVGDGAEIKEFRRHFRAARFVGWLEVSGVPITWAGEQATLGGVSFRREDDLDTPVAFAGVPSVVFSEVMGDVHKIAGGAGEEG